MKKTMESRMSELMSNMQDVVKYHRSIREEIANVRYTLENLEAESEAMESVLETLIAEMMEMEEEVKEKKCVDRKLITIVARRSGDKEAKVWISAASAARNLYGTSDEWAVKRCFNQELCGNTTWFDNLTVHDIGKISYACGKLSRWIDEEAFADAKRYAEEYIRDLGGRKKMRKEYNEDEIAKRYDETGNQKQVAKEFDLSQRTVSDILKRKGVSIKSRKKVIAPEIIEEIIRLHVAGVKSASIVSELRYKFGYTTNNTKVCEILRANGYGRKSGR